MIRAESSILKNTIANVLVRGGLGVSRLVLFFVLAPFYGPDAFGQMVLAYSIAEIFRTLGEYGIDTIAVRRIAAEEQHAPDVVAAVLRFKFMSSAASSILAVGFFWFVYGSPKGLMILLVLLPSFFTGTSINTYSAFFQARLEMSRIIKSYFLGLGAFAGLIAFFLFNAASLPLVMTAVPLSELLTLVLLRQAYRRYVATRPPQNLEMIRQLVRDSSFVALSSAVVIIYLRLDATMIGAFLGEREVGEYGLAFRLLEPFQLYFSSLSISLFASLSKEWGRAGGDQIRLVLKRTIISALLPAIGGGMLLFFVAPPLLKIYVPEFEQTGKVLAVLTASLLFKAVNPLFTAILNSLAKFRFIFLVTVNNLVVGLLLNLLLLPAYGILGAAITIVSVEFLNSLVQGVGARYGTRARLRSGNEN